jgi:TctA family transporter
MNNDLYVVGGIACLIFGLYISTVQIKKIKAGKQDQLGFDYKLLGGGIMFIIIGLAFIIQHW